MDRDDRYARQRLIEGWDQDRLGAAQVLVAGAGALGNELLKNLALMGVGHLLVIDFDRVEASNLSRCALFSTEDVGRPKVAAAAAALARLNPEVEVRTIQGDLFYDVGLGWYRHADLAIGCLDSLAARSQVGLDTTLAGIPYLDGGMWALGGEVRSFLPGDGPCFDCTLSTEDYERANERRSCTGFRDPDGEDREPEATLATTAAIVGGLLAQEAVKLLCGLPFAGGRALVYNGQTLRLHRAELERNPDCRSSHTPYENVVELRQGAAELIADDLLQRARLASAVPQDPGDLSLELGRDFLVAFRCPKGHGREEIGRVLGRVRESAAICPRCGILRQAEVLSSVDDESPYVGWSLASLGVPEGDVIAVRTGTSWLCYELGAGLGTERETPDLRSSE